MAAGIAWRVLRQSPGCSSKRMRMPRMLRTSPKAGDPQADAQLFLHAPQQVFQSSVLRRASRRAASALLFLAGQEEDDGPRRRLCARVRRRRRRAGRAGGRGGSSWHHHSRGPASRAATLRRPRERASALQRHLALLLQAAEDGVGDLHPLGIDSCGWPDHQAQVAAWDERHVGAEAVGGTGLSAGAGPPAPVARAAWDPVRLQRHRRRVAACRRFREIGQS